MARAQKKAAEERRTIVGVDQSGFYLLPMAVRTYAPRGQTPVLRVPLTRDHLVSDQRHHPDGRLFMQVQDRSYRSEHVVRFLRLSMRKISGKLLVIWDGAPIHRGQEIKVFLPRGAAKRLQLEQLPGYAPELNPDEGNWNLREAGSNSTMSGAAIVLSLATELRRAKDRLRHKPGVIRGCVRQCGCEVDPVQKQRA